jgi:hypothetical protein
MRENGHNSAETGSGAADSELASIVDDLAERARRGEAIDWPLCYQRYRKFASELKELSPAIEMLARIAGARQPEH